MIGSRSHIKNSLAPLKAEARNSPSTLNTAVYPREIIGYDDGLSEVFQMISSVAKANTTVLIVGETGTGKELIANAIHDCSFRSKNPMVKLNCAALPSQLIESELFGHEKGSFTGAIEKRIGKFESAAGGTLFLDEISELGLALQSKLLRALQEKEIVRVGGLAVIKTDVRIITATNRDLKKETDAGRFRQDLFYRLNVFPIKIPPLRERKEDIPALAHYFINKFSTASDKKIEKLSTKVIKELMHYNWPGNIRELEHVIERSVLMCSGNTITDVKLLQQHEMIAKMPGQDQFISLAENERAYILSVLKKTAGRIRGKNGAAEILKIPPTTLHSKIKKLGIRKTSD